ncbi:hypothetical protein SCOR_16495 [Sulfidibacter corallicola]
MEKESETKSSEWAESEGLGEILARFLLCGNGLPQSHTIVATPAQTSPTAFHSFLERVDLEHTPFPNQRACLQSSTHPPVK